MIRPAFEPDRVDVLVIGGGIAGLAYAHTLVRGPREAHVVVLEAERQAGGAMRTLASPTIPGLRFEFGPEAVADDAPETLALAREVEVELVPVPERARRRLVVHGGELHELPTSLGALLKSRLLSAGAKAHALGERLRSKSAGLDGSLWDFAVARLGPEFADKIVDSVAVGIFCGDAKQLSLRATLPLVAELVERHGSLTGALLARKRPPTPVRPQGGWGALAAALARSLGQRLRLATRVTSLAHVGDRWRAEFDGGALEAPRVVLATPAPAAAELVSPFAPELATELAAIEHESIATVTHVWKRERVRHPLDAFGYLVSRAERDVQISTQFASSIDPTCAPDGLVVLRTRVGGARQKHGANLNEDALASVVMYEVAPLLGLSDDPELLSFSRAAKILPRYDLAHPERIKRIDALAARLPHFELVGNYQRGAGINAIVADVRARARRD